MIDSIKDMSARTAYAARLLHALTTFSNVRSIRHRTMNQLFVEAVAKTMMGSCSPYDHEFIVKGLVFGAKKGPSGSPTAQTGNRPPVTPAPSAGEAVAASV